MVVLGRSMLVGKPFALLALERNATVTIAHSKTRDLPAVCRTADVLVAAVGRPRLVQGGQPRYLQGGRPRYLQVLKYFDTN